MRRVGHVLLSARRRHGRALVVGLSTDAAAVEELRGDLRAGPCRISPPRRRHRRAHGDRRVAGRRRRSPPRHADESLAPDPHHRVDQLRGSRPRAAERRPRAPGLQQSVRADRDSPRLAGHSLHAPAARARRETAVDVPSDDRARHTGGRHVLRNGPGQIHRSQPLRRQPGRVRQGRPAFQHGWLGARSDCRDSPGRRHRTRHVRQLAHHLRHGRNARGGVDR